MARVVRRLSMAAAVLGGLCAAIPGAAEAQGGDGFLFDAPNVSLKFESGYGWQSASSDIYDWVVQEHTIGRRDFDAPYFGGELGVRVSERLDVAIAIGYQSGSVQSEYRDWVDTDNLPIYQTSRLKQIPAVASLKVYPFPRGRQIGRFAWVPRTLNPFIGGGIGFVSWDFEQVGDFVDYETLDIYYDRIVSNGESFLARAQAGFDVSLSKQFVLTVEGRYNWSSSPMEGGFVGFDNIDLDGLQAIGGLAIRF
jgi:hypothetical protein